MVYRDSSPAKDSDEGEKLLLPSLPDSEELSQITQQDRSPTRLYWVNIFLVISNVTLAILYFTSVGSSKSSSVSEFAGLTWTVTRTWGPLHGGNSSEEDHFWNVETNLDAGMVALADDYVKAHQLPIAQRFPWDNGKGLYILSAYHGLHCVKVVRDSLTEFNEKSDQSRPWGHVLHCLRSLRDDVMCAADDTPRYTGYQPPHSTGLGQTRVCRDWSQLENWAHRHTACWRYEPTGGDLYSLDDFRNCPDDSPYKTDSETKWLNAKSPVS